MTTDPDNRGSEGVKPRKALEDAVAALRESEERYALALNASNDGIWDWNIATGKVFFSDRWKAILGYAPDGISDKTEEWKTRIHPEDFDRVMAAHRENFEGKIPHFEVEYRLRHKDGSYRWILGRGACLRDDRGVAIRAAGSHTDITARKQMEGKLIHIMKAVESSSNAIGISDSLGHHFYQNKAFTDLFGYTTAEELEAAGGGKAVVKDPEVAKEMFDNIMSGKPWVGELEMVTKSGRVFPAFERADAIKDNEGNVIGLIGIVTDISERKRAEEVLRQNHELLLQYMRHSPIYTYIKEVTPTESRVLHASDNFEQMIGIPGRDMTGKTMEELFPAEFAAKITADDWAVVSNGEVLKLDEKLNGRNYTSIKFPIVQGDKTLLAGYTIDITEQERAEEEKLTLERQVQQAQKMESLGVLAGGIAHDFNNILMVVLGRAELALEEISPMSPARRNLEEITIAARRAADLSLQMLAYAGKATFLLEQVVLRDLVEEMAHLLKAAISKKAILNLNLERGLPLIEADPSQIRQIVMNLIINASEAIGDRSGVITVSVGATRCDEEYLRKTELREALTPGLYVHMEVTDTGCGMDAETRVRIFEPFFSTKFTGRGLGLAAALGIVRAHKGALKVYSEPGKGTTFKVLFPALEEVVEGVRTSESSPLSDWRGTGTILLVDDEESLIALGARMLEHLGFTVLTAADGLQAVDLYHERGKEIDLVLMDLTMPHMDGAEAFGELRRLNPNVPVVLASGYSREDVTSRFAGKQLDGMLQKPYTISKLRRVLAGLLPKQPDGEG